MVDFNSLEFKDLDFHPFIVPDNVESITFDSEIKTLMKKIEKTKPEIFEDKLAVNMREKILNSINIDRLYIKNEVQNVKGRPPQYSSKEIKEIATALDIAINKKSKDDLIRLVLKEIH